MAGADGILEVDGFAGFVLPVISLFGGEVVAGEPVEQVEEQFLQARMLAAELGLQGGPHFPDAFFVALDGFYVPTPGRRRVVQGGNGGLRRGVFECLDHAREDLEQVGNDPRLIRAPDEIGHRFRGFVGHDLGPRFVLGILERSNSQVLAVHAAAPAGVVEEGTPVFDEGAGLVGRKELVGKLEVDVQAQAGRTDFLVLAAGGLGIGDGPTGMDHGPALPGDREGDHDATGMVFAVAAVPTHLFESGGHVVIPQVGGFGADRQGERLRGAGLLDIRPVFFKGLLVCGGDGKAGAQRFFCQAVPTDVHLHAVVGGECPDAGHWAAVFQIAGAPNDFIERAVRQHGKSGQSVL